MSHIHRNLIEFVANILVSVYIREMKYWLFLLFLIGLGLTLGDKPLNLLSKREYLLAVDTVAELAEKKEVGKICLYYADKNPVADDLKNLANQYPTADICVLISSAVSINELEDVRLYIAQNKFLMRLALLFPDNPQNYAQIFTYVNYVAAVSPSAELLDYAAEIDTPIYKFITLDKNTDLPAFLKEYYKQKRPLVPLIYIPNHEK